MRLLRIIAITAIGAASFTLAAPSVAATLLMPDGPARTLYQGWADTAAVPTVSGPVEIHLHDCTKYATGACTDTDHKPMIVVFPDLAYLFAPGFPDAQLYKDQISTRLNFIHELGHVLDFTLKGRGGYRQRFMRILGITSGLDGNAHLSWQAAFNRAGNLILPYEQFAMAYADCGVFPDGYPWTIIHRVYWAYSFYPTAGQYQRLCSLMRTL